MDRTLDTAQNLAVFEGPLDSEFNRDRLRPGLDGFYLLRLGLFRLDPEDFAVPVLVTGDLLTPDFRARLAPGVWIRVEGELTAEWLNSLDAEMCIQAIRLEVLD